MQVQTAPSAHSRTPEAAYRADGGDRFEALLAAFRGRFERGLAAWLAERRAAAEAEVPEVLPLHDALADLAGAGGKRLRPALIHFTHLACGGRDEETALRLGIAAELFHLYLLVHDDVMDHAAVRRGRPAVHERFAARHRDSGLRGDAADFGCSAAILAGDLAHSWAVELFGDAAAGAPTGTAAELRRILAAMSSEVIGGQLLELRLAEQRAGDERDLSRVLRLKSGRYSVERPIELGAALAGAPEPTRAALARYGGALGEAFQLQDDVLGLFGDADTVGKPVGGDLAEGKYTWLVHLALERLDGVSGAETDAEGAAAVRAALGHRDLAPDAAARAVARIRDSGALERVRAMIAERLAEARAALGESKLPEGAELPDGEKAPDEKTRDGRDFLAGLIDGLGRRRR